MQKKHVKYFDEEGHLTTIGRTLYVDAMKLDKVSMLPIELQQHINDCVYCSSLVILLFDAVQEMDYSEFSPHPLLKTAPIGTYKIGGNQENIEQILNQLKAEAIKIPSMERLIQNQNTFRKTGIQHFSLKKPIAEALCFSQLDFEFETPIKVSANLSIRGHRGRVFKGQIPPNTQHYTVPFTPIEQFVSGLYYWKLTLEGGKPVAGRFYIYQA